MHWFSFGFACCFLSETLRKYPIATVLNRTCVKDYKIPGTDKVIEKGTEVFIPVLALQRDEKFYNEPEKFKPGRFIDDNSVGKIYLAFGDGPRNCIATKLGKIETKVGLVLLLFNYKYELESTRNIEFDPKNFALSEKDRIELRVIKR